MGIVRQHVACTQMAARQDQLTAAALPYIEVQEDMDNGNCGKGGALGAEVKGIDMRAPLKADGGGDHAAERSPVRFPASLM